MQPRRAMVAVLTLALAAPVTAVVTTQAANAAGTGLNAQKLPRPERQLDRTPKFDKDSVLVKFKKSASRSARDKALSSRGAKSLGTVAGTAFVKVDSNGKAAELVKALKKDKSVAAVSLDYVRKAEATPNDPGYTYTYPDGTHDQDYLKTVRMPQAWDVTKGSTTTKVAVLDSGVNGKHEDLSGKVVGGYNTIVDQPISAGVNSDDNGHGSFVASIIAAKTNNGIGMAGVDWGARIMPVKVLNSEGYGLDSDIAQGIQWAALSGAKVINLSLGGSEDNPVLRDAVAYANARGAVVVAAAGNTGGMEPHYPAAIPEVIAVGATDWKGALTDFSTTGDWVDVTAPGWGVLGAGHGTVASYEDYWIGDGTSYSAPIVSGIISLMRTKSPSMTPAQLATRIRGTARDAGPRGFDPYYGAGVVDAYYALGGPYTTDFPQTGLGGDEPNEAPARATTLTTPSDTGLIGIEGDVDWYKYTSTSTRAVDIKVTPPAYNGNSPQNLDAAIAVYDEDLKLVGEMDAGVAGRPESLGFTMGGTAEAPRTYYLSVRNWNGARSASTYSVSLTNNTSGRLLDPRLMRHVGVSGSTATAVGDLTGDGKNDVVATLVDAEDPGTDDLIVWPQTSSGSLGKAKLYATAGRSTPRSVATGDVNGDGRIDLVVGTDAGPQVMLQDDNGTLGTASLISGYTDFNGVAVADFDGDSDSEIAIRHYYSGIKLLTRQDDGSFSATQITSGPYEGDLAIGDVDGDNRLDIVTHLDLWIEVNHNTASGWTSTNHVINTGGASMGGVAILDTNGDGRNDIVSTVTSSENSLYTWVQGSDGTLGTPLVKTVAAYPGPVRAADINGDQKTDVVIAHGGGTGKVSVIPQLADGGLGNALVTPVTGLPGYAYGALSLGDFTGDGKVDAAVPNAAVYDSQQNLLVGGGIAFLRNSTGVTQGSDQAWVRSVNPADTATGLPVGILPQVTFVRALDPATVTSDTVQLVHGKSGAPVPATVSYNADTKVVTIDPTQPLHDFTPFRIHVAGVHDADGAEMAAPFSTTFRTTDLAPGPITALTATGGVGKASLTWTLPAASDLNSIVVRMAAGSTPPSSITSGTQVYAGISQGITVSGLANGATYSFRVWVKDRQGKISATAPSVKLIGTGATISSNTTSLRVGSTVTITGKVTRRDSGAGLASVPVQLQYRRKGASTWSLLTTRTSSSTGTVSYAHKPGWSIEYRWVYSGTPQLMGTSSPARVVTVS